MHYSWDTYRLYYDETLFSRAVRVRVIMKEEVRIDILRKSVNIAIQRYPYYSVRAAVDGYGAYVLLHNPRKIVVLPTRETLPDLCTEEINEHLLYLDTEGRDIYFNISHSLSGGKGIIPFLMTCMWQYILDCYGIEAYAPAIRKPGSPLLPDEVREPEDSILDHGKAIYEYPGNNPAVMIRDYLAGLFIPWMRNPNYRSITFQQKDLVYYTKGHDASIASLFLVVMAKALDRVLPEKEKIIGGEIAHSPCANFGIPNAHCDLLTHVHIDYDRVLLKRDMTFLSTVTRGSIILQTDPSVSSAELRKLFSLYEELDEIRGLRNKLKFMKRRNPSSGKDAKHGTFIVNYAGWTDWGEVADYVESFFPITEGHLLTEITSIGNRIVLSFMQLLDEDKYFNAFLSVLDDLNIPYKTDGPFPKRLVKHRLPKR